jgi:HSF-type DNA-binding
LSELPTSTLNSNEKKDMPQTAPADGDGTEAKVTSTSSEAGETVANSTVVSDYTESDSGTTEAEKVTSTGKDNGANETIAGDTDKMDNDAEDGGEDDDDEDEEGPSSSNLFKINSGLLPFPEKLMSLLDGEEMSDSMWWLPDGDSFCLVPVVFAERVLDKHFQGTKFESFTRKLNRWYVSCVRNAAVLVSKCRVHQDRIPLPEIKRWSELTNLC